MPVPPTGLRIIFTPYHVGLRNHRVGNGPHRILAMGLEKKLQDLGVKIDITEIEPVDDYEGEIGRSFEVLRRVSRAVMQAVLSNQFPLVLSGNCMASAGVACGLRAARARQAQEENEEVGNGDLDLGFIYFDAHDDLDSPDVNENGYFDAMGLSMLRGESWKTLMRSVPGFEPFEYAGRFLYCGLRDQSAVQRQRVIEAGMHAVWGGDGDGEKRDFAAQLAVILNEGIYGFIPTLVHLDLDVLDESYGKVNDYPSPGGIFEEDLVSCLGLVGRKALSRSLTVCSFDPDAGDGDRIAKIAIRAVVAFVDGLLEMEKLGVDRGGYIVSGVL
ncbi:arginase family protein [Aspergillus undulatus]|uniref:arginase family protein n=1 Tax=Aspergillus undulatus TaxID=1810928 RepID=UPI003CCE4ACE